MIYSIKSEQRKSIYVAHPDDHRTHDATTHGLAQRYRIDSAPRHATLGLAKVGAPDQA
jgi:hypothetical protein